MVANELQINCESVRQIVIQYLEMKKREGCVGNIYDFARIHPIFQGKHPGGGQRIPTSIPLPPTSREDLRLDGYLENPHAAKALYIDKHPCLLRYSNTGPAAPQSASSLFLLSLNALTVPGVRNSPYFRALFLHEWNSDHNAAAATRNINVTFRDDSVTKHTIRRWYAKFESRDGSHTNEDRVVNNEVLRVLVKQNPDNTLRNYAEELGATHKECFFPARRRFVEWAQNEIAVVPNFHKLILFSDEAHFWLNGYVNKQNCRIWSEANPQVYVETQLHPEKLTVWCALWTGRIIGPYFFKTDEGHNVTVKARATIDLSKDTFGGRLISRFRPVNWPPRSCDLTPLDYFLWAYLKSLVYADKPQTLDHLEDNIRRVITDIRSQMLEKVIENRTSRLDYIRASRGSPMPEIVFKM
ncbi:putative transposable element [Trichonephila clavipes]|nr:putative transposable element [Trichonephila clavipes]